MPVSKVTGSNNQRAHRITAKVAKANTPAKKKGKRAALHGDLGEPNHKEKSSSGEECEAAHIDLNVTAVTLRAQS